MALSSKALQQKRTKKAAKRKAAKKSAAPARSGTPAEWLAAAHAPIADVYTPEGLFETGLGSVWIGRKLDDGRFAMSAFLVDTFCLGVKSSMYAIVGPDKYHAELDHFLQQSSEKLVARDPAYARKLVELAVAYAGKLGLEPDADYKTAKIIFGDIDAASCPETFSFGLNGNPVYISGPGDTPARQRTILKQLEKQGNDPMSLLTADFGG